MVDVVDLREGSRVAGARQNFLDNVEINRVR